MSKNSAASMLRNICRSRKPPKRLGESDDEDDGRGGGQPPRGRGGGLPPRGRGGGHPTRGRGRASRETTVEVEVEDEDEPRGRPAPRARGRGRGSRTRPLSEVSSSRMMTPSTSYFSEVIAIMPTVYYHAHTH